VIDDFAKDYLHEDLRSVRRSVLGQLDDLSEYEIRRPMTSTGTNLLGLVKHLTMTETVYFGEIFGRAAPWPHLRYDDPGYRNRDSLWVGESESRADIVDAYRRAWAHADATIDTLPIDTVGLVAWWPEPTVTLFNVMIHVLTETNRHAGHADILREQLIDKVKSPDEDLTDWYSHRERIERSARRADSRAAPPTDDVS
jgi:hypothetical protein